jgi:hypothetical protein
MMKHSPENALANRVAKQSRAGFFRSTDWVGRFCIVCATHRHTVDVVSGAMNRAHAAACRRHLYLGELSWGRVR